MTIEERVEALENRLAALEKAGGNTGRHGGDVLELDLVLPEAGIGGLHFNEQKVHAVFEKKEDGKYYSQDILFHSARDTDEDTGRDLLSEYLASQDVKDAFIEALTDALVGFDDIRVFLPEENQGIKKYNGVSWWYWLRPRYSGSAAVFCGVNSSGSASASYASAVGGCAPAFCVCKEETPCQK